MIMLILKTKRDVRPRKVTHGKEREKYDLHQRVRIIQQVFKRWVIKEVLPSIRKTGRYSYDDINHKYNEKSDI